MQKHTIAFAVITNKDGVVIQIGRSEILQPQVIKKKQPCGCQKKGGS